MTRVRAIVCVLACWLSALAFAIPTGSMGLRPFDANGQQLVLIDLRVEHVAGQWVIEPFDVTTRPYIAWVSVPAGTYAIYALGNTGEPYAGPPAAVVNVAANANDLLVPLIVPTPCPGDADDDRTIGVNDFLVLLAEWGPCLGCASDTNDDNQVDVNDFLTLLAGWGACPV